MNSEPQRRQCPTCGKMVDWNAESRWRPFCSERCRLIDLGAWADEGYRIPGEPKDKPDTREPEQPDED